MPIDLAAGFDSAAGSRQTAGTGVSSTGVAVSSMAVSARRVVAVPGVYDQVEAITSTVAQPAATGTGVTVVTSTGTRT